MKLLSRVWLFATPWTVAYQDSQSMGFSRQQYWSGPFPSPGDLPHPVIKPESPTLQATLYCLRYQVSLMYSSEYMLIWASLVYKYTTSLKKIIIQRDTYTWIFSAALFIIAKTWKQPKCLPTDEWIKKIRYVCTLEYYSVHFCTVMCAVLSHFSCVWLFVTPWTVACQAPLSMGIL